MREKSVITSTIETAQAVFAPGHLGELTQIVDFALVDAVLEETGHREKRLRLLPSRVVVYFVLTLALFEHHSYRAVWSKLTAALTPLALLRPAASSLARARRRMGAAPLRRPFEILAGPVARAGQTGSFYRGLRTVAIDGTLLHTPDDETLTRRSPKRAGEGLEFGYPLLRLLVLVECGTRALMAATLGPESQDELPYAARLLTALDETMLLLSLPSVVQVEVVDVVDFDVRQAHRAASAVLEADVPEPFGDDAAHLPVAGSRAAGVEQALRVAAREADGEAAEAAVVGGADRCGVAEPGPRLHCHSAGGGLLVPAFADLGLPTGQDRLLDLQGNVLGRVPPGAAPVAANGAGGDAELSRDGFRGAQLP